jgi:tRNA pseudouridine38-40 synthase
VIRLDLAYDGTDFHGWAKQPGVRTVEGVLGEALARVLGEPPKLTVAGRTDTGVHASGQVASFVAPPDVDPARFQRAANRVLAPEVVVRSARRAPDGFDARRSATGREYVYRIDTAALPDPVTVRFVWHHPGALQVGRMREAAKRLIGERDFASFGRPPAPSTSTVRDLRRLTVSARGTEIRVRAVASGFLHQMVRSLVGTLVAVGEGKLKPTGIPKILAARDRGAAGPVAPPQGLALVRVFYGRG